MGKSRNRKPKPTDRMELVADCRNGEEFVASFSPFCDEEGLVMVTTDPPAVGVRAKMTVTLSSGEPVLRAWASVAEVKQRDDRASVRLTLSGVDDDSRALLERMASREPKVAADARMTEALDRLNICYLMLDDAASRPKSDTMPTDAAVAASDVHSRETIAAPMPEALRHEKPTMFDPEAVEHARVADASVAAPPIVVEKAAEPTEEKVEEVKAEVAEVKPAGQGADPQATQPTDKILASEKKQRPQSAADLDAHNEAFVAAGIRRRLVTPGRVAAAAAVVIVLVIAFRRGRQPDDGGGERATADTPPVVAASTVSPDELEPIDEPEEPTAGDDIAALDEEAAVLDQAEHRQQAGVMPAVTPASTPASAPSAAAAPAAPPAKAPAHAAARSAPPARKPVTATTPAVEPPRAAASGKVRVVLDSTPPGASFRVNGNDVGKGPKSIELPAGGRASVYATLDGLTWHNRVDLDKDVVNVRATFGQ